ncbi:MAG: peptidase C25 [Thermoplasmata archaeon]|nr:MAG: peptidase C25 [Thermoplasmata archaeon]
MRKIIPLLILGILVSHTLFSFSVVSDISNEQKIEKESFNFNNLKIENYNQYISISHDLATSYTMQAGEPVLPIVTKTYKFPIGTMINHVDVEYLDKEIQMIDALIRPSPKAVIDGSDENPEMPPSISIYESSLNYPSKDFTYDIKIGLDKEESTMFVNVHCYPVLYVPIENKIEYYHSFDIEINYQLPKTENIQNDGYDLLIIAPSEFASSLQALVAHKNSFGMKTEISTLDEIYANDNTGRDNAETIKLFIKQEKEASGITYVMIVGGHKGQSTDWLVPVRYAHSQDETYLSDLYYADLFKYENNETVFEDWDSNGNGKIGEYSFFKKDKIDGAPDVYIGRLACRNVKDVDIIVNKIINYEKQPADESWFKKMLLIGGDTYPESPIAFEAEIDTNLSASYMDGFSFTRLWTSTGALTGQGDVENAMNQGAGFIHMAGHANPSTLVTHPPFDKDKEQPITILTMYDIYDFKNFNPVLNNDGKLPIIIIGGCHNSQYNVSFARLINEVKEYGIKGTFFGSPWRFYYKEWIPKCFSWWLTIKEEGGAIATFGNTGLGMGIWDYGYLTGLDGWLFPRFFYHYGVEGIENIGMAQGAAITDYVNEFDINNVSADRQMVQQWALLGDPSLLAGGYPN